MKLMVIGHGRHGKDTVCEILKNLYGLTFVSSSEFVGRKAVYPQLKDRYTSFEECYADRHNNRALWFDLITEYNSENPARLGLELYNEYDIYCGLRSKREFNALRNREAFFASIWVDRSDIVPHEPSSSMTIEQWMADYTLDNNGTPQQLEDRVTELFNTLRKHWNERNQLGWR